MHILYAGLERGRGRRVEQSRGRRKVEGGRVRGQGWSEAGGEGRVEGEG